MLGSLRWRPVSRLFGPTRSPCLVLLGIPRGSVVERHAFQLQAKDRPKRKLRRCRVGDQMGRPLRPPRENMEDGNPVHELHITGYGTGPPSRRSGAISVGDGDRRSPFL